MAQTRTKEPTINTYRSIVFFALPVLVLAFLLSYCLVSGGSQQFSLLANSYLHGKLYFLKSIGLYGQDPVLYHGKVFWDDGPFPSIILMPFVAIFNIFHAFFYQAYLQWLLVVGIVFFIFKLGRKLNFSIEDSLLLALCFTIGSVFIGVGSIGSSWLFAQVVTTFLLFWGLYEYFNSKRWWLIGLICAFILMTRITAAPVLLFFVLELLSQYKKNKPQLIKAGAQLILPVIGAVGILAMYNYLRFGSPLNGGYEYQLLSADSQESRSLGMFSLIHIPENVYAFLLSAPRTVARTTTSWTLKFPYLQNNPYGISVLITSPYLLNLFTSKWSAFDSRSRNLIAAAAASALMVFTYFGIGIDQYGYRYSLDFLPIVFFLFMIMYRKKHPSLTTGMKILIYASMVINFYLASSYIFS